MDKVAGFPDEEDYMSVSLTLLSIPLFQQVNRVPHVMLYMVHDQRVVSLEIAAPTAYVIAFHHIHVSHDHLVSRRTDILKSVFHQPLQSSATPSHALLARGFRPQDNIVTCHDLRVGDKCLREPIDILHPDVPVVVPRGTLWS